MKNLLILVVLLLAGCQEASKFQDDQLLGTWNLVAWKDLTNDKTIDANVEFKFEADSRYVGTYGSTSENGKFWISGDNLHTVEDGKAEKKVKIEKLENDTLIFGMNRAGNVEQMILVKAN
ncbi:MAG: lipocalin family protein [Phaeodactylibacter sp.]|nr:lipocalin family protein [Phaeodactylibacter sp.]